MSMTWVARADGPEAPIAEGFEISVVMPCLNEARTVGQCVDKAFWALQELGGAWGGGRRG